MNQHEQEQTPAEERINTLSLADAAAYYAANGWPVFPLHSKYPYEGTHGYRDATLDSDQIQQWWTEHPKANIGIPTSDVAGLLVLDVDMPDGHYSLQKLVKGYEPLPETRRVRTGNGGIQSRQSPSSGSQTEDIIFLFLSSPL